MKEMGKKGWGRLGAFPVSSGSVPGSDIDQGEWIIV